MRATFRAELDQLIGDLARMGRLASQIMINASSALLQADLALAELVIARCDEMDAGRRNVERRCSALPPLRASGVPDPLAVAAVLHTVGHLQRMGQLGQHTAKIARFAHPGRAVPDDACPVIAQMSLLASGIAQQAATAIEKLDPLSGDRLAQIHDEVTALRHQLCSILFVENGSGLHSEVRAVYAAIVGRYYERFADHAVSIARQIRDLAVRQMTEPLLSARESLGIRYPYLPPRR